MSVTEYAASLAAARRRELEGWGIGETELAAFSQKTDVRVLTPGSRAGERLHLLSSLETRSPLWDADPDAARVSLSAAVSLVLRLVGRDADPARSREHVLLSVLGERRLRAGESSALEALVGDVLEPPVRELGALPIDRFFPAAERRTLAASLNALLASPSFAGWREGAPLDVGAWLTPRQGRTPAVIVGVAHLSDDERSLVLGVLMGEVLAWVRSLPGTRSLKALVVFDEVSGFLPRHPANPPTKRHLVSLLKQARAFGVGVLLATQNPMDLDYRALGNAGLWCVGRLQTDADRARVVEGLAGGGETSRVGSRALHATLRRLAPRWFVTRDAHEGQTELLRPRQTMSLLRGSMTRAELRRALDARPFARPLAAE